MSLFFFKCSVLGKKYDPQEGVLLLNVLTPNQKRLRNDYSTHTAYSMSESLQSEAGFQR